MKNKENNIELLSPAGDMESLIAAVQNGANAVYFGADKFNARANSKNFDEQQIIKAINYAKLRNVKTHLTLNILIKNNEFTDALDLVKYVYELGIDAIIVQDLGLASRIKEQFSDLEVHVSTQSTIYNIQGVNAMSKLGFDRIVLARELNIQEITNICKNTDKEIEVFIHGALCISYSGQCLISSIIGARSGNRGKCAGTCRLPYELVNIEENSIIEKGCLLSSKDVCTLDILPELIQTGVKSLKIEGRMKSPEYVGIVTKIYRKYIHLYFSGREYTVDEQDRKMLLQIFNRGGFSTGYLKGKLGNDMMYHTKPNHIGLQLGKVISYNSKKGYVNVKLNDVIDLGDSISINDASCKTSELMINNENIKKASKGQTVTIGRIKGQIYPNDIVYKTVSDTLNKYINTTFNKENIKRRVNINIELKENDRIKLQVVDLQTGIKVYNQSVDIVQKANNVGTTKDRIIEQINRTGNTIFEVNDINIDMQENVFIQISSLNEIRRIALEELQEKIIQSFRRNNYYSIEDIQKDNIIDKEKRDISISVLLNCINPEFNYTKLNHVKDIYIPYRLFFDATLKKTIINICNNFNTYIYFPAITKGKYIEMFNDKSFDFNIKGCVLSNPSQLEIVKQLLGEKDINLIANYTMNIFNDYTINKLKQWNFNKITISPEMNKMDIASLSGLLPKELIVYGRTLLMTSEYCVIGKNVNCKGRCKNGKYILKDKMNYEFPVYTDRVNCNSLIYNSKILSIKHEGFNIDSIRIDILDEEVAKINSIIDVHINNERLEGTEYTNGNINKEI